MVMVPVSLVVVASWREDAPDPSSKATLWVKAQHEGALPPPCGARGGFLPRHDEDLREPLVRRPAARSESWSRPVAPDGLCLFSLDLSG